MLLMIEIFLAVIGTLATGIHMVVGVLEAYHDTDVLKYNSGRVVGSILLFAIIAYLDTLLLPLAQH